MPADGLLADADLLGGLFDGGATGDASEDLDLPRRQAAGRSVAADLCRLDA